MNPERIDGLWSHLHWLTVLHQQGSFTAAAARLGVSKAAMSQHIAELERAAGVPLVHRTTRSVRLTEAGERLVEDTRGAFEKIRDSFAGVRNLATEPQGLIRVTAPVAFARQQLLACLPEFLGLHPRVRIELDMSDRLRALAVEGFDLAVRHTAAPPETHVAWSLATTRTLLVASKAYLRRRGAPQTPNDLTKHDCLAYPRAQESSAWAFVQRCDGQRVTIPVDGPFSANNSEVLRDAAVAGVGIALLPDFSAQSALQNGKLVELLPEWRNVDAFGESIYALRPYSPQVPRAVAALVAHLRQCLAKGFEA